MKYLLPLILASAVYATQAQAQSKYDICSAYARDAMVGFYSSSAVPVTMADRSRGTGRGSAFARALTGKSRPPNQTRGSLQTYFAQCMAR